MIYEEELALELKGELPGCYKVDYEDCKIFICIPDNYSLNDRIKELLTKIDLLISKKIKSKPKKIDIIFKYYSKLAYSKLTLNFALSNSATN